VKEGESPDKKRSNAVGREGSCKSERGFVTGQGDCAERWKERVPKGKNGSMFTFTRWEATLTLNGRATGRARVGGTIRPMRGVKIDTWNRAGVGISITLWENKEEGGHKKRSVNGNP